LFKSEKSKEKRFRLWSLVLRSGKENKRELKRKKIRILEKWLKTRRGRK